jgi:hypothetical protein
MNNVALSTRQFKTTNSFNFYLICCRREYEQDNIRAKAIKWLDKLSTHQHNVEKKMRLRII